MYIKTIVISLSLFCCYLSVTADNVKPWQAQAKGDKSWLKTHNNFLNTTEEHRNWTKVMFIGASIMTFWQVEGKEWWNSYYKPRNADNYGIPGDTTSNLLWRIQNYELDGLKPKVIVLQIGFNDFAAYTPKATAPEIARGIIEVVNEMLAKCPESKVINIGITPIKNPSDRPKAKEINELLKKNADEKTVYFLDIGVKMIDSKGDQKPGLFKDGVHLTTAGFAIWQQEMQPLFEKLDKSF